MLVKIFYLHLIILIKKFFQKKLATIPKYFKNTPPPPPIRHNKDVAFYMNARPAGSGVHFVWLTLFVSTCAPSIKVLAFSGVFLQQI